MILSPYGSSPDAMRLVRDGKAPAIYLFDDYSRAGEWKAAGASLVVARVVLPDDLWRQYADRPHDFFFLFLTEHVSHPANRAVDVWVWANEDYRKLFDNEEYKSLSNNPRALADWLNLHYYKYMPGVDKTLYPNSESPDFGDIELKARFDAAILRHVCAAEHHPTGAVAGCARGAPSGTPAEQLAAFRCYRPALREAAMRRAYIDLHTYHLEQGQTLPGWEGPLTALMAALKEDGDTTTPIFFGECGSEPGYKSVANFDGAQYAGQMIAFDRYITGRYGRRVRAAFVFCLRKPSDRWRDYVVDGDETFIAPVIAHGKATAGVTPAPTDEPVLFTIPPTSLTYRLYPKPVNGMMWAAQRRIAYAIDVFETRDVGGFAWWRVTRKTSPVEFWMRVGT